MGSAGISPGGQEEGGEYRTSLPVRLGDGCCSLPGRGYDRVFMLGLGLGLGLGVRVRVFVVRVRVISGLPYRVGSSFLSPSAFGGSRVP